MGREATSAKKWLNRGFLWVLIIPPSVFAFSFIQNIDYLAAFDGWGRLSHTEFPAEAGAFIVSAILALLGSVFAAVKFAIALPIEGMRRFEETVMLKKGTERKYEWRTPIISFSAICICVFLLLCGPVDMAIMDGLGVAVSRSPIAFVVTQMMLVFLSYICIAVFSVWIVSFVKLSGENTR